MPTTRTGYWIRVQDGGVTRVQDTPPPFDTEDGWLEAVEVIPDLTPDQERLTHHTIDISKTPCEIVWHKVELTIEDRKNTLVGILETEARQPLGEAGPPGQAHPDNILVDPAVDAKINQIRAATTHEELDMISSN